MRRVLVVFAALALAGSVAYANFCARDVVPAATLLFPYVAVSTDASGVPDPAGLTTITGILNVSATAQVIHFTVWDIQSVPRVDFDEILSGYDALQINWRDFLNGRFDLFDTSRAPFSASAPLTLDPFEFGPDGRGQGGGLTAPQNRNTITSTQCPTVPPYGNRSDLAGAIRTLLIEPLVARSGAACTGAGLRPDKTLSASELSANPIIFYVTVDVVQRCNLLFPDNAQYWDFTTGPTGVATTANVLIGDTIYLNSGNNYSEMFNAVHVEANSQSWLPNDFSFGFYERFGSETLREPLATAFAFRYGNDPLAGITSNVIFWKNYTELNPNGSVNNCGAYVYYAWDMDERTLSRTVEPISGLPSGGDDLNQFPFETQKVALNTAHFDLPASYGWFLLVLPPAYGTFIDPTPDPSWLAAQKPNYMGWAGLQFVYGTYSAGTEAATLANTHCFASEVLPALNTNNGRYF